MEKYRVTGLNTNGYRFTKWFYTEEDAKQYIKTMDKDKYISIRIEKITIIGIVK